MLKCGGNRMYDELKDKLEMHLGNGIASLKSLATAEQIDLAIEYYKGIDADNLDLYLFLKEKLQGKNHRSFFETSARKAVEPLIELLEEEYQKLRQGGQNG
jgi:hypothetical protein